MVASLQIQSGTVIVASCYVNLSASRQSMKDVREFCCEERIRVFRYFNAKGSFDLQENKSNEKGLIVDCFIDIHPECI